MSDHRENHDAAGVTILGSTGTIGVNTLDVLSRHPERYRVMALTAHNQVDRLLEQCHRFKPKYAVLVTPDAATELVAKVRDAGLAIDVLSGNEGLRTVATLPESRIVMAAIVGAAGLFPTLAAVQAGKRVLFANKEPLVMAGGIFIEEAKRSGSELLPIDSEHNAIFQCLPANYSTGKDLVGVRKIILTCSGGPFRTAALADLAAVTPDEACAHPKWSMGPKISVDSATLMNKGLEVIEACWLFNTTADYIQVVIHPQSIVHSMVEYVDGSVLAQLSNPDMRVPIAHALAWPSRIDSGAKSLDLLEIAHLNFEPPNPERFPCLKLAYEAARVGGTAPAVLNAANEVAVQAFLDQQIDFPRIAQVIEHTLSQAVINKGVDIDTILADDTDAREQAENFIKRGGHALKRGIQ